MAFDKSVLSCQSTPSYNLQYRYIRSTYNDNHTTTTSTLTAKKDCDKNNKLLKSSCGSEFHHVMSL